MEGDGKVYGGPREGVLRIKMRLSARALQIPAFRRWWNEWATYFKTSAPLASCFVAGNCQLQNP